MFLITSFKNENNLDLSLFNNSTMPSLLFTAQLINEIGTRHKSSAQLLNEKGSTGEGPPMQLQKT